MSLFLKIYDLDPYQSFIATLRRSRLGMRAAFSAAFAAHARCVDLMQQERWLTARSSPLPFPVFAGNIVAVPTGPKVVAQREELRAEAQAQDLQTDMQASVLLLSVDDMLQRFRNR